MEALGNLVQLQKQMNRSESVRLPILDQLESGFFPSTAKDMALIRHEILRRARERLPAEGIYLRGKSLFNFHEGREIDRIPEGIYQDLFKSHKVMWEITETQTATGQGGVMKTKKIKRFEEDSIDLDPLRAHIENESVMRQIVQARLIPDLVWQNEVPEGGEHWVPPMPEVPRAALEAGVAELNAWGQWMMAEAPAQWDFFLMLLQLYCFANERKDAMRKIMVGIGSNGGGKGSMIKMLNCIPNTRGHHNFVFDAMLKEYRTGEVFLTGSPMAVCHEFQLNQKVPTGSVGLVKSATRNETLGVRSVGEKAKNIVFHGGVVFFCNSNHEPEGALFEAQRFFAEWVAYDRFSIAHIDWFHRYPRSGVIRDLMNAEGQTSDAFGLALWHLAQRIREVDIPAYPIPIEFRAEGGGESLSRYDVILEQMLEGWSEFFRQVRRLTSDGRLPPLEDQRKLAMAVFAPRLGPKSGLLATEFRHHSATAEGLLLVPCFSSGCVTELLRAKGANRKWQVPPSLRPFIQKGVVLGNFPSRERSVVFDGESFDAT